LFTIYNGKLYKVDKGSLVGVDITPSSVKEVEGTKIKMPKINTLLTLREVQIKFGVVNGNSYKFPVEEKVVPKPKTTPKKKVGKKDEPVTKTKKPTGKSK